MKLLYYLVSLVLNSFLNSYWKCNFPVAPSVRLLVGWLDLFPYDSCLNYLDSGFRYHNIMILISVVITIPDDEIVITLQI